MSKNMETPSVIQENSPAPAAESHRVLTKKDIRTAAFRYMFMACNVFNYESQQGPGVVFGLKKALRKLYPNDEDYRASLDNQFKYFNTTTWMANILLGASLAMEEKDGLEALDTVQNFKTGMMGPLAGIGDTLIWVLYPTIMGSIAAYMGLEGNPIGAVIWMVLNICFLFLRFKLFDLGYESGLKLITALGDKLQTFTQAASIMGLTVVGALIPSVIHMTVGLEFAFGEVALNIQTGVLDSIMPALLPALLTFTVYKLLSSRKMSVIQIIFAIIALALVCSFFGILTV
ncbi:PTS system mannose/fructose/sorbose family transporter subunit IID [uncultured Allobaculum sp.]|uniref:PTS system mannose/fructose/sorbose family transporter subunit IID n=1 Tax=uncultured Allobaculum sp. TaxID=1187017 RepID=UPI00258E9DDC|nr:PTS system mannose/fructose/sorbose family transporter subunit IID [uncultured Allobaculum sp.]